jgi:glycosyltransferase involved in cell wall biosynthesis
MDAVRKVMEKERRNCLFLSIRGAYWTPESAAAWISLARRFFPETKMKVTLPLRRADHEFNALYTYAALTRHAFPPRRWLEYHKPTFRGYETCFSFLRQPLDFTVTLEPTPSLLGNPLSAVDAFLSSCGFSRDDLGCEADFSPPVQTFSLSRDFLAFCAIWHTIKPTPCAVGEIFPWSTQAPRFSAVAGYAGDYRSFFSPEERRALITHYADVAALLAKQLRCDHLFPDPEPEPDWEPFTGLTPETAYNVAERLDRDFARARMAEFDAAPMQYLTREQHLCRAVLHDVLDDISSAPFIRSRAAPKLSVLTLTYNHASFIDECIESVLAQQVDFPMQHIIADDGSDDGTQDIILEYAAKYPHIVPVFQKTRSYGRRNVQALFDMCRTEYAAICDGDDYFTDPLKLQTQVNFLDKYKDCALCFHVVRVMYEDFPEREDLYPPVEGLPRGIRPFYYLSDIIKHNLMQTNSAMYRWRFKNGLPDWFRSDLCPGDWYWHILHAETGKIGFINKTMSVYRRHPQGLYYLSTTDRLKHRYNVGMNELKTYDAVNRHFDGKFQIILSDLANGVIADWLLYSETEDIAPLIDEAVERYPDFAKYFLAHIRRSRHDKSLHR